MLRAQEVGHAWPRMLAIGDAGLVVEFGDAIDLSLNEAVMRLDNTLARAALPGVVETVPSYRSLLVEYDPAVLGYHDLVTWVETHLQDGDPRPQPGRRVIVPVAYDTAGAEDLLLASELLGLAPDALILTHLAAEYRVYMIGFMPGFAYLGGLPPALHLRRRTVVRPAAPKGSIMIGGMQSAIAAVPLRTGWYVIGQTPARGFEKSRAEPFLFRAGDRVRFRQIDAREFAELTALAADGRPVIEVAE